MKFEHARFEYQVIRNFNWKSSDGYVTIFKILRSNGFLLVFNEEEIRMHVPQWAVHEIESRGVPLLGIRPAWIRNEIFFRMKVCFHEWKATSCVLDHMIGNGGSLHEMNHKFFIKHRNVRTGDFVYTPVPWSWDFVGACLRYWRFRAMTKVRFLLSRGPYYVGHLRFHFARFTRPIRFFYDRLVTSMGRKRQSP